MSTNNALAIYSQFDRVQSAAVALYKSGYFTDTRSAEQAIVKVMAGAELGLPPFASMTGIHIIQGKPVLGANVLATLVKNDPRYDYRVKKCDNEACVLEWFENGRAVGEAGFTFAEAQNAGLTNKDNWKKWTSDMLFARAISRGARRFAPGVFGGSPVYTPDELGADVDEDGYIVAEVREVEPDKPKQYTREDAAANGHQEPRAVQPEPEPATEKPRRTNGNKSVSLPQLLVNEGLAENVPNAANILNALGLAGKPEDEVLTAAKAYRDLRNAGKEPDEAAEMVKAGYS